MTWPLFAPHSRHVREASRYETQGLYCLSIPGNYVKIGISFDVIERVRQLQSGCPEKITVGAFLDTEADGIVASRMEREVHAKLAAYRTSGEWFNATDGVIGSALKEVWIKLRYPEIYDRLERMRAHKRSTRYRRKAEERKP